MNPSRAPTASLVFYPLTLLLATSAPTKAQQKIVQTVRIPPATLFSDTTTIPPATEAYRTR